jgi:hypothetical protein
VRCFDVCSTRKDAGCDVVERGAQAREVQVLMLELVFVAQLQVSW